MKRHTLYILLTLMLLPAAMVWAGRSASEARMQRAKARSYYYDAARFEALQMGAEAHELYRKAWQTDPTFSPAAVSYAFSRLHIENDSLGSDKGLKQSLALAAQFIDEFPGDTPETDYYAYIATVLDTIEEAQRVMERLERLYPQRTQTLLSLAKIYAARQMFDKAIEALDTYSLRESGNIQIDQTKLSYMIAAGDTLRAIDAAQAMIADHPSDYTYPLLAGSLYAALEHNDKALEMYSLAETIDPSASMPKMALATLYNMMGDSTAYDNKIYEALLAEDMEMEEKIDMVASYLQTAINDKADRARGDYLFSVLSRQYPHEASVLDLSARYNAAKGDFDDAIEQIGYAIDQNGTNENYWSQLMTYQIQAERYADAMGSFSRAKEHIAPSPGLRNLFAAAAQMNGDTDRAVGEYTSLIRELAPSFSVNDSIAVDSLSDLSYDQLYRMSEYMQALGDIYYPQDSTATAFMCYENAIRVMPYNSTALNNYAYFLTVSGGDLDKAADMAQRALQIDPENPTVLDTYAWVLFKKGDYKEALTYQQRAVEKSEEDDASGSELYSHYGDILFMNGDPAKALEYWEKALEKISSEPNPDKKQTDLLKRKIKHKTFFFE